MAEGTISISGTTNILAGDTVIEFYDTQTYPPANNNYLGETTAEFVPSSTLENNEVFAFDPSRRGVTTSASISQIPRRVVHRLQGPRSPLQTLPEPASL
jgi:hypothetical protein